MKKILSILVVLILAALLAVAWQWRRAVDRLNLAAGGGIYQSLGLKLEIAPGRGGVKGLLRLKPYVEIPQVVLDLAAWGHAGPIPLGSARLSADLWHNTGLLLVLEPGAVKREGFEARRLAFELSLPDLILGIRAEGILFRDGASGEVFSLEGPWLQLGSHQGLVPENLNFRLEGLRFSKNSEAHSAQEFRLGPMEWGYSSGLKGAERHWNHFFRGQGGVFAFSKGQGEIAAWSFLTIGHYAELPFERWKQLSMDWAQMLGAKSPPESLPSGEPLASYDSLLKKTAAFLVEWRPQIEMMEFRWAGLKVGDLAKKPLFSLGPMDLEARYFEDAQGLATDAKGSLKGLQVAIKEQRFEAMEMSFSKKARLKGLRYGDWLKHFADYYAATLSLQAGPKDFLKRMGAVYGAYLSQMPDELSGEIRFKKINYQDLRYQSEHRGAELSYSMGPHAWDYRLKDDFDFLFLLEPDRSIRQGKIDLDFAFQLPWGDLLHYVRNAAVTAESAPSLPQILSGHPAGIDWKWNFDLGPHLFGLQVDLAASGDAGKFSDSIARALGMTPEDLKATAPKLAQDALRVLFATGKVDFGIKIDRLSKLQAAMDKIYSGSSMGLAILGPYVLVDAKSDAMQAKLNLHNGEVLLNGKKNPTIEGLLRKGLR